MKVVATIEARMTSSRLPGKIMMPLLGRPMLERIVERIQRADRVDDIVIATTGNHADDPVEELAARLGVACFRGSEEDVLDRVLRAARSRRGDLIVEAYGDCPLVDAAIIDRVIESFLENEVDYCSNLIERTFPRGMDVEVFPTAVLEEVAQLTDDPADREHVSIFIYCHPEKYRLLNVTSGLRPEQADLRLTVDTREDFDLIREIYERLYPVRPDFGLPEILALFDRRPELREINQQVRQKAVR